MTDRRTAARRGAAASGGTPVFLGQILVTLAVLMLAGCGAGSTNDAVDVVPAVSIIPMPREVVYGSGNFVVTADTRLVFEPGSAAEPVAEYFAELLRRTRGIDLTARDKERSAGRGEGRDQIRFELSARERVGDEEGYSLAVSPARVVVSAGSARGLLYGAVSLWQLLTAQPSGPASVELQALTLTDAPRFRWRGLMLDSARHYQSPQFIKHFIDVMALHKLNVLHWHLTDDQAWRLEIRKYPKLTAVGAWRVPAGPAAAADIDPATGKPRLYGGFYSQQEVREIVAHATSRHITVVPEIEMPGHASAAIAAYPQLGVTDGEGASVPADWGIYSNLFNIEESTFAFLEDVLDEVLQLFPSEYIHIGGDEAVKDQWRRSARVQARMRELGVADEHALQSYFIQRMEKYLSARGRRLIGWDEILEGGLAPNATVMSWRGIDGAVAAAAAGHDAVLAPWPTLYLDNRPLATASPPGRGRIVSVEDVYRFDPAPAALDANKRRHILGVQANVWTEHIRTEERVEYMTFPRAAALAEVAWSPAEKLDWTSFSRRLPAQLARYRMLDVMYAGVPFMAGARSSEVAAEQAKRRTSHELNLCSDNLVLSLEDDAPVRGERAIFLVDLMNPCWIYPQADLSRVGAVAASVGQVPFNFQIGADVNKIPVRKPAGAVGELEIRRDGCQGEKLTSLSLAPAQGNYAVTQLPAATIAPQTGKHDLCFTFTQAGVDPLWVIDAVELIERTP